MLDASETVESGPSTELDTAPVIAADGDEKGASKRAMRREKRRVQWEERKTEKKLKRQRQQRDKLTSGLVALPKALDMSDEAVLRRKERTMAKRENHLMAAEEGINVVIDCEFEEKLTEKEKKSLSQQIMCVLRVGRERTRGRSSLDCSTDCWQCAQVFIWSQSSQQDADEVRG